MLGLFRCFALLFFVLCIAGCNKTIRTSSGKTWYTPGDRAPFQQGGNNTKTDEFDNEIFINGGRKNNSYNSNNYNNTNQQTGGNKQLENAVNNSFALSQPSALQKQEKGQVDLTSSSFSQPKQQPVQKGNIVFTPLPQTEKQVCDNVPKEQPPVCPKKVETKKATKNGYRIQCGNYVNKMKIDEIAKKLKSNGINNVEVIDDGNTYKVFAGLFANKSEGQDVMKKIKKLGYDDAFWVYR